MANYNWISPDTYGLSAPNVTQLAVSSSGAQQSTWLFPPSMRVQSPARDEANSFPDAEFTTARSSGPSRSSYSYFVRLINPKKKSDYVVRMWHNTTDLFTSPARMKLSLMDYFGNEVPSTTDFQVGYFEPPSNTKRWIVDERDLKMMYSCYEVGSKINLWCERRVEHIPDKDNECPPSTRSPPSKRKKREQVETDDEIFKQLREKNPKMEAPKLRLWAKLIQSGRHDSYDVPPQIPLITGSSTPVRPKKDGFVEALTGAATTIAHALNPHVSSVPQRREGEHVAVSPLRMTTIRRSCLQDLKMLKELLEDGVLTEIEFTEEKQNILATLKDLKK